MTSTFTCDRTFCVILRDELYRAGLTQGRGAEYLGINIRTLQHWLAGDVPHVITQEGALARLAKLPTLTQ